MRICLFGTYQRSYPRNVTLLGAFKKLDIDILECHEPLWEVFNDRSSLVGKWGRTIQLFLKQLVAWIRLTWKYLHLADHDLIVVLYPGHFDLFLARALGSWLHKPIVYDVFLSLFDLYVCDRKYTSEKSLLAKFFLWIDKMSCQLADKVLIDTDVHADFFSKQFGVSRKKIEVVPVGCDEAIFYPREKRVKDSGSLRAVYFGKYIPFHGVDIIVRAASILKEKGHYIQWILIGSGQDFEKVTSLARQLSLDREIQFISNWVEPMELAEWIKEADICLGVFGKGEKADRVVPCKIFNALAMAKPIVTEESTAVRQLIDGSEAIFFCERGSPASLASAIARLTQFPEVITEIGKSGYQIFQKKASNSVIISKLGRILREFSHS